MDGYSQRRLAPGISLLLLLGLAGRCWAHNPDTSYCRIAITSHQVECKFTYDLLTLQRMVLIDANHDNQISRAELAKAAPAIQKFLRQHVYLDLNQREAEFGEAAEPSWPGNADGNGPSALAFGATMRTNESAQAEIPERDYGQRLVTITFRNPQLTAPEDVTITFDFFEQLGGAHTVLGAFTWNGREEEVIFTRFEPDFLYDTGYSSPLSSQLAQYLKLGVKHIFLGYDHIAFLLALLFVKRFVDLLKVVTAFTVAHTLTLALSVLQIVRLPPPLVEIGIAATIMYVAAENLWLRDTAGRWMLTFGFGLVHGFGFASVLRELGLPSGGLARSLLSFNLGVELGQIAIVALLWPALMWVSGRSWSPRFRAGASMVIFILGAAWLCERTLGVKWLPI